MTMTRYALATIVGMALAAAASAAELRVVAASPAANVPANADAVTGVLRRVAYSDREVVVIGPGPKGTETETTVAVPEAVAS